jgi:glycosyltransferase involved in cell wall biosynthesis
MPVRNGQRFIRLAIDSLLAQTFSDFELIICDNASTDQTQQICQEYVSRDSRVRYFRNETDLGPAANYNRCFELSRGEYFRWHAHDDQSAPEYLAKCVELLDRNSSVVVAYTKTLVIDEYGTPLEEYQFNPGTDSARASTRFRRLVLINHRSHRAVEIFGLMRASALRQTPLHGCYARADSVLLVRMALRGRFVELPDRLFLSRSHTTQSMQTLPASAKNGQSLLSRLLGTGPLPPPEWWDASRKGKANFPEWNLMREYWVSIRRANLRPGDRLRCRGVVLWWLLRNPHKLARDVIFAIECVYRRALERLRQPTSAAEARKIEPASAGSGTTVTPRPLRMAAASGFNGASTTTEPRPAPPSSPVNA